MVRSDRRFAEAHSAFLYLESLYVLTENVYKAARQNYNAVSRRITQRGQEIDQGNRTTNVNNMPAPGAPLLPTRRR